MPLLKHIRIEDQATLRMVKTVQESEGHPTITKAARALIQRGISTYAKSKTRRPSTPR